MVPDGLSVKVGFIPTSHCSVTVRMLTREIAHLIKNNITYTSVLCNDIYYTHICIHTVRREKGG